MSETWVVEFAFEHDRDTVRVVAGSEDEAIGKAARRVLTVNPGMILGWWLAEVKS